MLEAPHLVETSVQLTAVIPLRVLRSEIRKVMGPGISELRATLAAQGVAAAGPWFTHHLRIDPEFFDLEIGLPVKSIVRAAGRVQAGQLPAVMVARTVYHGTYEGLEQAWGEFETWIATQGLTSAPDLWECYVAGPESSSDSTTWRTQLNRPLLAQGS